MMYPQKQLNFVGYINPDKATGSPKLVALFFMATGAQPHHLPSAEKENASDLIRSGAGFLMCIQIDSGARTKARVTLGHRDVEILLQRVHADQP